MAARPARAAGSGRRRIRDRRHHGQLRSAVGAHTAYLVSADDEGPTDPLTKVPEFSRRAHGVPVWAALRSLGRAGVSALVEGLVANARALSAGIAEIPGAHVLNEVAPRSASRSRTTPGRSP